MVRIFVAQDRIKKKSKFNLKIDSEKIDPIINLINVPPYEKLHCGPNSYVDQPNNNATTMHRDVKTNSFKKQKYQTDCPTRGMKYINFKFSP